MLLRVAASSRRLPVLGLLSVLVLVLSVGVGTTTAAVPAASTIHFTTKNNHDLWSVRSDGAQRKRLTRTSGRNDLDELFPAVRGRTVLFQMRTTAVTSIWFPGFYWLTMRGSKYDVVQYAGGPAQRPRLSMPFHRRFTSSKLPMRAQYRGLGAPALAPRGRQRVALNCTTPRTIRHELCMYDYQTKRMRVLTKCDCVHFGSVKVRLSWSRNGRYIAFAAGSRVYRYDIVRSKLEVVHDAEEVAGIRDEEYDHATISPDGAKLAVRYSILGGRDGIRVIDVKARESVQIPSLDEEIVDTPHGIFSTTTIPGEYYGSPSFSPDGTRLAISVVVSGYNPDDQPGRHPTGIWSIDLTGGDFRRITPATGNDFDSTGRGWSIFWGS